MPDFEHVEDVIEWLQPMGYAAFWEETRPYRLTLQDRASCDAQIARGDVPEALVLRGLKTLARVELTRKLGLERRIWHPPGAPH
ncbi:hypothetical protein [Jiella pacifica]|uniref:Uncharacterized protein n=1 Tax=Jiella pacifica TaxID=2696469 RepID=A0A6N9T9V2_9HYPH|nr:hypothetical protein [Jiella pacifica]NDW06479.1 hypothetical protein [Jiella pacifica]